MEIEKTYLQRIKVAIAFMLEFMKEKYVVDKLEGMNGTEKLSLRSRLSNLEDQYKFLDQYLRKTPDMENPHAERLFEGRDWRWSNNDFLLEKDIADNFFIKDVSNIVFNSSDLKNCVDWLVEQKENSINRVELLPYSTLLTLLGETEIYLYITKDSHYLGKLHYVSQGNYSLEVYEFHGNIEFSVTDVVEINLDKHNRHPVVRLEKN